MKKIGSGFKNFSRTQLGLFWFLIGFSLGIIFVITLL